MEPIAKRPVGRPRKTPATTAPTKPKGDGLRRAALKAGMLAADAKPYSYAIKPPTLAPGVVPPGVDAPVLAMDANAYDFAQQMFPGGGFPGFAYLSQLATRAEYRAFAATMSTELTREWLEFTSKQDDDSDSADKIKAIEEEFKRLNVRGAIQRAAEQDCYFGRAQIFLEIAGVDRSTPLILDPRTIAKGSLERVVPVEAIWTTPAGYNALDPAAPDFYKPSSWFMLGQQVHASRLMTVVTRPLPDILKPAFNFAGMSLSQLAEPYVDNWLRTRQSVADLINNFSITALATSMDQVLQGDDDGADVFARAELFTRTRSNKGLMLLDKEREEIVQVNTPLSGLHELQAQSQEHMCSVSRMPAIVLTGISPSGLNASSDGEVRIFYDWVAAQQEAYWREPLEVVLKAVQLSLFGEIDPDIGLAFIPLYQMTPAEESEIRAKDGVTDCAYVAAGIIDPSEVRDRLAKDPNSGYMGLDTTAELVNPNAAPLPGESDPLEAAQDADFDEGKHPRADNGQFGSGGGSKMYRGQGEGSSAGENIKWVTPHKDLAEGYAAARPGGRVDEHDADLSSVFNAGRDVNRVTPKEFAMKALTQAKRGGTLAMPDKEAMTLASSFAAAHAGDPVELPELWADEAGRERVGNFLKALGFSAIKLDEDGKDTYGLLSAKGK